jgi:kynureninase
MHENSLEYAKGKDQMDPISPFKEQFYNPKDTDGKECIYLCGNSLGLQPKAVSSEINSVLSQWQNKAVEGHFEGEENWIGYNDKIKPSLGKVVGASPSEVAIANTLTVNLHLLMMSFYQPTQKRFKIIIEKDAFPSDKYAVYSQIQMHGFSVDDALIEVSSSSNNHLLTINDFVNVLEEHGEETALVLVGGINYFTGQILPFEKLHEHCSKAGCYLGVDLAHAVGNIPLHLNAADIDFAVWCHYKYLNAGPGAIGGFFIHEKHHQNKLPRLEGWWGNHLENRFKMEDRFNPATGAEAWVMSTPPTLAIAPLKASLAIFDEIGMDQLRKKSIDLTDYLHFLLKQIESHEISVITPDDPKQRGCQLSVAIRNADKSIYHFLLEKNVMLDWREPNVIRVSPTPLYNSYKDVWNFVQILKKGLAIM